MHVCMGCIDVDRWIIVTWIFSIRELDSAGSGKMQWRAVVNTAMKRRAL